MRFSEIFLRLGCALVAWMMLYAHFVWLAALGSVGCGPDGDELHRVLLAFVPFSIGFAFLLRITEPMEEVNRTLRWLALPLAPLMLAGAYQALLIWRSVLVHGQGICSEDAAAGWQQYWSPAQLLAIVVCALMVIRAWRNAGAVRSNN